MKKLIIISVLILTIIGSVVAGTLSNYTTTISDIAYGSVTGKDFIFLEDGSDTFQQNVKIAPTETVIWQFAVKNYLDYIITETDLSYQLSFDVHATSGKNAIDPLIITIKDENGNIVNTLTGTGIIDVTGAFPLSAEGQSDSFTVEIYWPEDDDVDIHYAGDHYGTTINVSAVASQIPVEEEDPEENGDFSVVYQSKTAWTEGAYWDPNTQSLTGGTQKHNFKITITNNSEEAVTSWQMGFTLCEDIYHNWDGVMTSKNTSTGAYIFTNPAYYNYEILPGESIHFEGQAIGDGLNPITSVSVNGQAVTDVECYYNATYDS